MKRAAAIAGAILLVLAASAFGGAYWYVAHPPVEGLSLPDHTVPLESERGRKLLESSGHRADRRPIDSQFEPQIYRSYCGVASAVTVLGAFGESVDQSTFFETGSRDAVTGWDVFFSGVTLVELASLLEESGVEVEIRYASESSPERFRREAAANLGSKGDFVVVNYLRSAADQSGGGHISPVAAFHESSDRMLVYDTADYKYPPFWISTDRLFEAMDTVDEASGRTRGYLLVDRRE